MLQISVMKESSLFQILMQNKILQVIYHFEQGRNLGLTCRNDAETPELMYVISN